MQRTEIITELRKLTREIHAETARKRAQAMRDLCIATAANDDCCCSLGPKTGCSHGAQDVQLLLGIS